MKPQEKFRNEIDDYANTIHAIIGFMNFYRYDDATENMKNDVLVFQGRKLKPSNSITSNSNSVKTSYVTPDIGILLPSKDGVLGEVKRSFPMDQKRWMKTFKQLMSYDGDLTGWPSDDGKINSHDIVLILHQSRAVAVRKFYERNKDSLIKFIRPFVMVEFNRSDERKPFYFFRIALGNLTENSVNERLGNGVQVPMEVFVTTYSTIKIYDSEPPLPYSLELIWTNVVLPKASDDPKFEKLRKNQKIDVVLDIDTIIQELYQGFSFRLLHDYDDEGHPKIPKREWVTRACEQLVKLNEASWVDASKTSVKVFFKIYDDVLDHFIELCSGDLENSGQMKLFENK